MPPVAADLPTPLLMLAMVHLYLWAGVAWMMFCRAMRLGSHTRTAVILSVSATGTMAIAQAVAPFVPGWDATPRIVDTLTGGALFLFLLAFVPSWARGAPEATRRRRRSEAPKAP